MDNLEQFRDKTKAINFAKKQDFNTHVVFVPAYDPDDDPDSIDYLRDTYGYEPYEVVWESN